MFKCCFFISINAFVFEQIQFLVVTYTPKFDQLDLLNYSQTWRRLFLLLSKTIFNLLCCLLSYYGAKLMDIIDHTCIFVFICFIISNIIKVLCYCPGGFVRGAFVLFPVLLYKYSFALEHNIIMCSLFFMQFFFKLYLSLAFHYRHVVEWEISNNTHASHMWANPTLWIFNDMIKMG